MQLIKTKSQIKNINKIFNSAKKKSEAKSIFLQYFIDMNSAINDTN